MADYSNTRINGQSITGAMGGVTVDLTLIGTQDTGGAGLDMPVGLENLISTNFNDRLGGTGRPISSSPLDGGVGNDELHGGNEARNVMNGGSGADHLYTTNSLESFDIYDYNSVGDSFAGSGIELLYMSSLELRLMVTKEILARST